MHPSASIKHAHRHLFVSKRALVAFNQAIPRTGDGKGHSPRAAFCRGGAFQTQYSKNSDLDSRNLQ